MKVLLLACLLAGALAHDHDEAFTIFIDLGDFHVTQADNHEFLHSSEVGHQDSVVLHLSESEMRHFMDKHNTHECEHPHELHDAVSFIQEAITTEPQWGQFVVPGAAQAPAAPKVVSESDEDAAVNHFRDAYRAFKYFGHAMEGVDLGEPAAAAAKPASSLLSSLIDDDDRRIFNAFASHRTATHQAPPLDKAVAQIVDAAYKNTMASYNANSALASMFDVAAAEPQAHAQPQEQTKHRHHHRHHHHAKADADEAEERQVVVAAEAQEQHAEVQDQAGKLTDAEKAHLLELADKVDPSVKRMVEEALAKKDAPAPAPLQEAKPAHHEEQQQQQQAAALESREDQEATRIAESVVASLAKKPEDEQPAAAVEEAKSVVEEAKAVVEAAKAAEEEKGKEQEKEAAPAAAAGGASRPVAPAAASKFTEFAVPASVYNKQPVPFQEQLQAAKHVPKRILIPRMEEPGPAIGGSSHPTHISAAFQEMASNTRPAAPPQLQMQVASAASTGAQDKPVESVKPSTLAQANDEALSAPEVVIF